MSQVDSVGIGTAAKKTKLVKKTILVRKVVQKGATSTATSTSASASTSTGANPVAAPYVTPTTAAAPPTPTRKSALNGTSTPSYTSSNISKSNVPVTPRKSIPTTARAASSTRVAPKTPTATSSSLSSPPAVAAAAAVSSTSTRATRKADTGGGAASSEPISTTTTTEFVIGPDGKKKKKITTTIVKKVIKKVKKPDESDVSHVKGESVSEASPVTPSSTRLAIEVETDVPTPSDANSVVATPIESEPNQQDTAVDENIQPESESIVDTEDIILMDESQQSSDTAPSTSQPQLVTEHSIDPEESVSLADAVPQPPFDSIDMQPISSTKVEEESKEAKRNPFTEPLPSVSQTFTNNLISTLKLNPSLESNHVTESLSAKSFHDETKQPLTTNTAPIDGAQLQSPHFFPKIRFIPSSASEEEAALLAKQARQRDHAIELQLLSERKARILAAEKARWLSVWQAEESARITKLNARRLAEIESAATVATKRAEEEEEDRRQAAAIEAATRLTAKTPQPIKAPTPTTTVDVSTPPIATSSVSAIPLQPTETVVPPLTEKTTEELSKESAEHRTAEEKRQSELAEHELEKEREKKRLEEKKILAALIKDMDILSIGTQSWKVPRARFASVKRVTLKLEKLKSVNENSKASIEASMKDGSFGISWGSKKSRPDQAIFSLNPADFQLFEGQSHGSFPKKLSSIKSKVGTNREEWSFTLKNSSRELDILNTNQTDHDRWMKFLRTIQQQR